MNKVSRDAFVKVARRIGNTRQIAATLGVTHRAVERRLAREKLLGNNIQMFGHKADGIRAAIAHHKARVTLKLDNGIILVGSDAHIWPGERTTAQRAFLKFCRELKPSVVVANGDFFDGAKISRHPRIGFLESAPSIKAELEAVKEYLDEVRAAARGARLIWPLGNHDLRYEAKLAALVPEYEGLGGMHLKDHFPEWTPCWAIHVNPNRRKGHTVIKHRWASGLHAKHNNVVKAGTHMVTGHLHALGRADWSNFVGDFYGVDAGTLADPYSAQFVHYTEDNAVNWRSGFPVLTYFKGALLQPEFVKVNGKNHVEFRGKVIKV